MHKLVSFSFKILKTKFISSPVQFSPEFLLKPNQPMSLSPLSSFFPCLRVLLFPMFLLPFLLFKCHFPYSLTSFHVDYFSYFYNFSPTGHSHYFPRIYLSSCTLTHLLFPNPFSHPKDLSLSQNSFLLPFTLHLPHAATLLTPLPKLLSTSSSLFLSNT